MNDTQVDYICEQLLYAGWSLAELEPLVEFLQAYSPTEEDRSEAENRRLEFLRWLVQTGRLVD